MFRVKRKASAITASRSSPHRPRVGKGAMIARCMLKYCAKRLYPPYAASRFFCLFYETSLVSQSLPPKSGKPTWETPHGGPTPRDEVRVRWKNFSEPVMSGGAFPYPRPLESMRDNC